MAVEWSDCAKPKKYSTASWGVLCDPAVWMQFRSYMHAAPLHVHFVLL